MCKRVQVKKGEVLNTPEILKECMKKPRHSKQKKEKLSKECHKDLG